MILRLVKPGFRPLTWVGEGAWLSEDEAGRRELYPVVFEDFRWDLVHAEADGRLMREFLHFSLHGYHLSVDREVET